jgi:hypothetical protein
MPRLANGQLNRVRSACDDSPNGGGDVFDAGQKGWFVEKPMVDGDIEALAICGE